MELQSTYKYTYISNEEGAFKVTFHQRFRQTGMVCVTLVLYVTFCLYSHDWTRGTWPWTSWDSAWAVTAPAPWPPVSLLPGTEGVQWGGRDSPTHVNVLYTLTTHSNLATNLLSPAHMKAQPCTTHTYKQTDTHTVIHLPHFPLSKLLRLWSVDHASIVEVSRLLLTLTCPFSGCCCSLNIDRLLY